MVWPKIRTHQGLGVYNNHYLLTFYLPLMRYLRIDLVFPNLIVFSMICLLFLFHQTSIIHNRKINYHLYALLSRGIGRAHFSMLENNILPLRISDD